MIVSDGSTPFELLFFEELELPDLSQRRSSPTPIMERGWTRHTFSSPIGHREKEEPMAISAVAELGSRHRQKRMATAQRPRHILICRSNDPNEAIVVYDQKLKVTSKRVDGFALADQLLHQLRLPSSGFLSRVSFR